MKKNTESLNKEFAELPEKIIHPSLERLEAIILSSFLNDSSCLVDVQKFLKPYHFAEEKNGIIYKAITTLFESNESIDPYTVVELLKRLEQLDAAGGSEFISKISSKFISDSSTQLYSKIIVEKWMLRQFIAESKAAIIKAQKEIESPFDLLSGTIETMGTLLNSFNQDIEEKSFEKRLPEIIEKIERERIEGDASTFLTKHFPSFDIATGGLKPGNLVVISGKYKSGKTRLSLALLKDYAVNSKIPVGLIGFEMSTDEYDRNLLSMQCGVRYAYLRNPGAKNKDGSLKFKDSQLQQLKSDAENNFSDTTIMISDNCVFDSDVTAKIKFWTKKHHLKIIAIDYLQLIESNKRYERRDLELSEISKRLKNIARTENVCLVILVQENERGESADSKGPLKDSDFWFSIVHPVDNPEYYIDDKSGPSKKKCVVKLRDQNGVERVIDADNSVFHVKFKASRHSANGRSFLCKFFEDGSFKELAFNSNNQEDLI